ncbi:MAG: protein phosphatase CheZ [Pigmentiphaga sp.]|nr:protein phosphatase CheZ [Pigmentiphaga sp.]
MSDRNDTEDLEALFDQISNETLARLDALPSMEAPVSASPAPVPAAAPAPEVLAAAAAVADASTVQEDPQAFYQRVGALTRQLHNALRELGYQKKVEEAVSSLPDTRQRLDYIARLTGDAANRALSNVEQGQSIQQKVSDEGAALRKQWDALFACKLSVAQFKQLSQDTRGYLDTVQRGTEDTQVLLTDIMMAQDFHDLTGQVIQKIVALVQHFEDELVKLLIESTPPEKRASVKSEWMNGPVIDGANRDDVVTDQSQVDELLESLGF